jgi:hypothetical protein
MVGKVAGMMIQKKGRKRRPSNDVMGNIFPNGSVRRRKQEGIEDTLVE